MVMRRLNILAAVTSVENVKWGVFQAWDESCVLAKCSPCRYAIS